MAFTFDEWKRENLDLDARLDAETKAHIIEGLRKCWKDAQTAQRLQTLPVTLDAKPDRRAELLELAGKLAVASLTREKFTDFKHVDETKDEAFARLASEFGTGYVAVAKAIIEAVDKATEPTT